MNPDGSIAPPACYPSIVEVRVLEDLHWSLRFALEYGNDARASELADAILDREFACQIR